MEKQSISERKRKAIERMKVEGVFSRAGKKGGNQTKRLHPNHFKEIAPKGGEATVAKYGIEMLRRWGSVKKGHKYVESND